MESQKEKRKKGREWGQKRNVQSSEKLECIKKHEWKTSNYKPHSMHNPKRNTQKCVRAELQRHKVRQAKLNSTSKVNRKEPGTAARGEAEAREDGILSLKCQETTTKFYTMKLPVQKDHKWEHFPPHIN